MLHAALRPLVVSAGVLSLGLLSTSTGIAQSGDTCADPFLVTTTGTYPFPGSLTTSGFSGNDAPCTATCFDFTMDAFFAFTPTVTDNYEAQLCNGISIDTHMALHEGSDCSATCLQYSDQSCGDQERIAFVGVSGTSYLIQVGGWGINHAGGSIDIVSMVPSGSGDTCADAIALPPGGWSDFFNQTATDSGFTSGICSLVPLQRDRFFSWTALADGDYRFHTCTGIGEALNTSIRLYSGFDCTATCIAANDDYCNEQSQVTLTGLLAGDQILIQVGSSTASLGGSRITVTPVLTPAGDTCATPEVIVGTGTYPWDTTNATTSGFDGGDPVRCWSPENCVTGGGGILHHDVFFAWTVPTSGNFRFTADLDAGGGDVVINFNDGPDCSATCHGSVGPTGANSSFVPVIDVPNLVAGDVYMIQVGTWFESFQVFPGPGTLTITQLISPFPGTTTSITCSPAVPNVGGSGATLATSFVGFGPVTGLRLECTDGAPNQFAFVLVAPTATQTLPVFQGVLCLDAPLGRYTNQIAVNQGFPQLNSIGQFDASGVFQNLTGTSQTGTGYDVPFELPFIPSGQTIQAGQTWNFQVWMRDLDGGGVPTANFSDVLEVTFN